MRETNTARVVGRVAKGFLIATLLASVAAPRAIVAKAHPADEGDRQDRDDRDHREGEDNDRDGDDKPIRHLVVIFQENVSFDHYFATYPHATGRWALSRRAARSQSELDAAVPAGRRRQRDVRSGPQLCGRAEIVQRG